MLNLHVFMRSNDAFLGTPYDVFNFSMLALYVCSFVNERFRWFWEGCIIEPGALYLTAASSHLYKTNFEAARLCRLSANHAVSPAVPRYLWRSPQALIDHLKALRETKKGDPLRSWETKL